MKKLNKLTAVLLALAMCLSLLPMSAFAANDAGSIGPHSFSSGWDSHASDGTVYETREATCEHGTMRLYKCDADVPGNDPCGEEEWIEDNDRLPHEWGDWELGGLGWGTIHTRECKNCHASESHSIYIDPQSDCPLCGNSQPETPKCSECGKELDKDNKCPHTEHTWGSDGKCIHTGCNETKPTDPEPKPQPEEHKLSYTDNKDDKTHTVSCSVAGCDKDEHKGIQDHNFGATGVCVCGAKSDSKPTEPEGKKCPHGHDMEYVVIRKATCKEAGLAKWDCSANGCNESEEVILPKLAHVTETTVSDVTETNHVYKCYNCGEVVTDEPHVWVKDDHKDPTCTEKGYDKYVCKHAPNGCDAVKTVEIKAKGHDFTGACVEKDENGHVYLCKNGCGEYGSYVEHDFGAWYAPEGQKATCEKDGVEVRECKDCHCKEQRTVKATGHKDEDPKNDVCDNCGADLSCKHPNKTRNQAEDVAATCQHKGLLAYDCPDCDRTIYEDGAEMLEHSYTGEYRDNENGTHARKCVNGCGEFGGNEAHEFGAWAEQEDGTWTRDCDCGAEETHTHTHGAPVDNGDGTHSSQCTDPNCPDTEDHGRVTEDHVDVNGDGVCDDCGAAIETEIDDTNTPLDEGPEIDDTLIPLASGPITRAEFVNYLWERENKPESTATTFLDVAKDHVYYDAIGWAEANDIAIGVDKEVNFLPDEYVTAGQVRLFLTRYAKYLGMEMPALTTLDGRDDGEAVLNCDEIVAEFFGEEYTTGEPKEDAE